MSEARVLRMGWDMEDGKSGEHLRTYDQGLRLTISRDVLCDFTECTVRIPKVLEVEAGPAPPMARVGDDWIALDHASHEVQDPRGHWDLAPEGLAMKFLRLAWLCAHDEVTRKHRHGGS